MIGPTGPDKGIAQMSLLSSMVPRFIKDEIKSRLHANAAIRFRKEYEKPTLDATVAGICDSKLAFCAGQRAGEIIRLLKMLEVDPPKILGEIGAASGGNLFLFAKVSDPSALIVSLELDYSKARRRAYPQLIQSGQQLVCIGGDSHAAETRRRVETTLDGRKFDFLFIDGDHSLSGVTQDFEMYAPFVRPGGLIAFHDIVEDVFQRYGRPTPSVTGGVPKYWKFISQHYPERWEFIDDPEQDGFGIGVIRWTGQFP